MNYSKEYMDGFTAACIYAMDIFESRSKAIVTRQWLRRKDIRFVVAVLDAMFRAREQIASVGPRGMNLMACRDGSFEFREKENDRADSP